MRKVLSLLIIFLMITILLIPVNHQTKAATFAVVYYPKYLPADCTTGTTTPGNGTPFAVYFQLKGFIPNTLYALKSVIGPYPADMTHAISWKNETTNSWADYYTAYTSLLKITTDSSGDWSGWLIAKLKSTVLPSGILLYRVRMRVYPFTGSDYVETSAVGVTSLNMSTQGGWIEGHAYVNGSPAANKVIIVKDGSNNIVGTYLTEDNSVNEGYNPLDVGYFKVAIPAGSDYLIEMLDSSDNTILASINNISVTAGAVTSGVNIYATVNNSPVLDWTGETNYISDGLNPEVGNNLTDFMYRIKYTDADNDIPQSSYPELHILKDNTEISGSPFIMSEVDGSDITYSDGKLYTYSMSLAPGNYTYFFEAKDANSADATGVSLSSNIGPSVLPIINALSNTGGTITPSGDIAVNYGADQAFTITPEIGYHIKDIFIDDVSQGAITSYAFTNVITDHIISAIFAINTFTINASAGLGGEISPSDSVTVHYEDNQTFTIEPDTGYHIEDVLVDGISKGAISSFTFNNITSDHTIQAIFAINTFTVTASAEPNGAVFPATQTVNYGSSTSVTITPNPNYHISVVIDNGIDVTSSVTDNLDGTFTYAIANVTKDHAVNGIFMINTYTITASAGPGGTISPSGVASVAYGADKTFTITPNTGYHIVDVKVDGVSVGAVSTYTFTNVTTNHTINVTFAIDTFTITASAGENGNISPSGMVIVNYNVDQSFTITPNTGYHVADVLVDGSSVGAVTSYILNNVTANHTINATFAVDTFTITASAGSGGTISPSGIVSVAYGSSQTFTITPNTGYHIADVKVDGSSVGAVTSYTFTNVIANHTIEAQFEINTYTLTVSVVGNGSVTKDPDQQTYDHGTTVTLTATPDTGYHFVSWSGDVPSSHETDNPLTITMDGNKSITATFVINTYIITASADEHGSVTPVNQAVNYGDPASVTITPDSGYCLAPLIDNCTDVTSLVSGNTYIIPSVKENHTIMTTFVINTYTVTITAGYGGSIMPYRAVIVCYDGTQAFVITPNQGYHIREVLIDSMSIGAVSSYTFTNVRTNHTIEAFFEINTYTITATVGSGGSISPSGIVIVNYGDSKTFTINSDPKFVIFMVLVDGHSINFTNPKRTTYTFSNISSNHTISAEFMKIPDITPPSLTLPKVGGIDLNLPGAQINTSSDIFTFTVEASDESGIARMVVKVNGVVQIDKNNLDPTIYLSEGENLVEVTVYDTYGNYTTKSFKIFKDSKPPVVNLTVPETSSTSSITITGLIFDEGSGVKSVLINGTEYMVPSLGSFSVTLTLTPGINTIQVKATDKIGNFTTKTYSVNYTPITSTSTMITLKIGSPYITINGISKKIDAQGSKPIIKNGRTLLPIRVLIESLGGTVEWNAKEQKVTIILNGHSIILWIGKTTALVDGNKVTLDVASQIINGRTYIPLRFVAENLNASVQWDQSTKTITIYYWP
jgi:hypothetical protein